MNTFVDFNTSKLLLDNGFEVFTSFEYDYDGCIMPRSYCNPNRLCSAPTIAETIMWLYDNHGIWVNVKHLPFNQKFGISITGNYNNGDHGILYSYDFKHYDSPKEAYLAAIEYCINKLI